VEIHGCIALITGANRGLGKAYAEALLEAGAAKVYAGAREVRAGEDPRLVPIRLDVTRPGEVEAAARQCPDVGLVINNAGILLTSTMLADGAEAAMRQEMEVNLYGMLRVARAFAPSLSRNGGGALVNVLSAMSWFTAAPYATYCASKHAALALTDALRIELRGQGIQVMGVHAGLMDTDMTRRAAQAKTPPRQVALRTLQGLRSGAEQVLADARAEEVWRTLRTSDGAISAPGSRDG
jgi:NAD(P)-dependent dehydrogenase (short-subunit alcohol dehydrogenase family)